MLCLTDLPDVVLLQVTNYLCPDPIFEPSKNSPFYYWPATLANQMQDAREVSKDMKSLNTSCKKLYHVTLQALYKHVYLADYSAIRHLDLLTNTLGENENLSMFVRTVYIDQGEVGADDIFRIMFLPDIHTLTITKLDAFDALELEDPGSAAELEGASPLQNLYLVECSAREAPLKQILSWPAALKTLYYDCEQLGWEYSIDGEEPGAFTLEGVGRAISPQSSSLTRLVFSRELQPHEGLGYPEETEFMPLGDFHLLRSLCISHVFLVGQEAHNSVKVGLPKSLVELEVYYDDTGYQDFLSPEAPRPVWLFRLLEDKKEHTPGLERVRIISPEWHEWQEEDQQDQEDQAYDTNNDPADEGHEFALRGNTHHDSDWRPPRELVSAFIDAGVSFSFFLHHRRRFRFTVEDGEGFEDTWEDTWKSDTG